ncbi:DUF302 domain-containing protein [Granulicella mallensis]|jgi:hypothetical protein|uniref:Uncharacterized protein (DUF302 family) n=1 Tax=Granulicella mallensis TaxID=940614 RepID=A0A7W7ZLM3_9BACT|nr:DUF302 domain-containing protein [Granulicella mallensis]MBB5061799.1 uncharacterized protein (DUF302 family) [Granulicella mallensis]
MTITVVPVDRVSMESSRSFEEVLARLNEGIGRPEMGDLRRRMDDSPSFAEFQTLINEVVGSAGLMEFLRLDLGAAMQRDPSVQQSHRMVRIIAGNPLIMNDMARHILEAGSYAPITILVFERNGLVHLRYDTMRSHLAPYCNAEALAVAEALDSKVIKLMVDATG